VVWLGKINVNEEVSFRWGSLMGERRIVRVELRRCATRGVISPGSRASTWQDALKLDELITRRIRLEDINDGFASLARGEGIRTVVLFDD